MGLFDGFLKGIAAPLVGGLFDVGSTAVENTMSKKAQKRAHKFSAEQAVLNREFSSDQFDKATAYNTAEALAQREWAEDQRATQYQTAIGDMKEAGLNPMLAVSQGGAGMASTSTPSIAPNSGGGSPSGTMNHVRGFGSATASAVAVANAVQDVLNKRKQGDNIDAQTVNIQADTGKKIQETHTSASSASNLEASTGELKQRVAESLQRISNMEQSKKTDQARQLLLEAQRELSGQHKDLATAQTKTANAEAVLRGLAIPKAENEARAQGSTYFREWGPYAGEVAKWGGSARFVKDLMGLKKFGR